MNTTAKVPDTNIYWNMLKNISDDMKIELIAKLSNSLLSSKKRRTSFRLVNFMEFGRTVNRLMLMNWQKKCVPVESLKMI